jgi:hypothetical protein
MIKAATAESAANSIRVRFDSRTPKKQIAQMLETSEGSVVNRSKTEREGSKEIILNTVKCK